jgi:hypothetical protein
MITSGSCPHPHLPHHGVSPRRLAEANDYAEALQGTYRHLTDRASPLLADWGQSSLDSHSALFHRRVRRLRQVDFPSRN